MNRTNINTEFAGNQLPAPGACLIILDSQMAASGYDVDHPWRLALADVIANEIDAARLRVVSILKNTVQQQAHEIESRIGNVAILVESIFDKLDAMQCDTPADHKINDAITLFSNSIMQSAQAIRSANEQILSLTGGVQ